MTPLLQAAIQSQQQNGPDDLPYLLFDAGGTVVFPNVNYLIEQMNRAGWQAVRPEQLYEGYYRLIHKGDQAVRRNRKAGFWPKGYASDLFMELGRSDEIASQLAEEIQRYHTQQMNLWTFTYPWIKQTLLILREQGYRMSVLSNSDGRAKQVIDGAGLGVFFERVFDSHKIGVEKPGPRIFRHALKQLGLKAAQVIYIGDIYEIDVKGANHAGLGAIHIDPLGKYSSTPGVHIRNLAELPERLVALRSDLKAAQQLFYFAPSAKRHSAAHHPPMQIDAAPLFEELDQPGEQREIQALIA